ncbi:MAG: lipopolysaccharide biosynthesis protein [Azonexus sp.]|nr:lipopolysaccharide biosynthesis protein [Azonexus sp.]
MKNLGAKSLSAVFWGTGGAIIRLILQFGAQVVLARILGPEQYGLFAIGAIVIGFSGFFSDIGLAYGLIQKETVVDRDIRFVFTWQVILGLAVTLAIGLSAEAIATFFGDARAADVVKALAIICLLNALAAPSLNLLKRNLDFRRIQMAQITGFIVGYVFFGIPLALYGSQAWALVVAWLIQATVFLALTYAATRHPLAPLIRYENAKSLSAYGATVLVTNLVNWLINNVDRVIIGRVFSSREIGLYATSYNMLYTPTTSLLGIVQPVFFSAASRSTHNPEVIASSYRALIGAVVVFVLPAFAVIGAIAETFVLALYGPKWHEAVALLRPLALAMPLFLIWGFTTPLLWTGGHASKEFRVQLPIALIWIGACWLAAQQSVEMVAWTVLALFVVRCLVIVGSAIRILKMDILPIWRSVRGGLLIAPLLALLVFSVDALCHDFHPIARLALDALLGALGLMALLRILPWSIGIELAQLLNRILDRTPVKVARHLAFLGRAGKSE